MSTSCSPPPFVKATPPINIYTADRVKDWLIDATRGSQLRDFSLSRDHSTVTCRRLRSFVRRELFLSEIKALFFLVRKSLHSARTREGITIISECAEENDLFVCCCLSQGINIAYDDDDGSTALLHWGERENDRWLFVHDLDRQIGLMSSSLFCLHGTKTSTGA